MCSGSEEGSYFKAHRLVYHSTPGWRVIKKKKKKKKKKKRAVIGPEAPQGLTPHPGRDWIDCSHVGNLGLP